MTGQSLGAEKEDKPVIGIDGASAGNRVTKVDRCLRRREGAGTLSNVSEGQEVRTENIHSLWSGGQW